MLRDISTHPHFVPRGRAKAYYDEKRKQQREMPTAAQEGARPGSAKADKQRSTHTQVNAFQACAIMLLDMMVAECKRAPTFNGVQDPASQEMIRFFAFADALRRLPLEAKGRTHVASELELIADCFNETSAPLARLIRKIGEQICA